MKRFKPWHMTPWLPMRRPASTINRINLSNVVLRSMLLARNYQNALHSACKVSRRCSTGNVYGCAKQTGLLQNATFHCSTRTTHGGLQDGFNRRRFAINPVTWPRLCLCLQSARLTSVLRQWSSQYVMGCKRRLRPQQLHENYNLISHLHTWRLIDRCRPFASANRFTRSAGKN
jgi:hypothetical protein